MDYQKKMLVLHCLLLMFVVGRCEDEGIFEMKTVDVGDDVTLSCTRTRSEPRVVLFWMRLVSGRLPQVLGATYTFDYNGVSTTGHITAKQASGAFILQINEATLNDGGFYFCIKVDSLTVTLMKVAFLRVNGTQPDIVAVIKVPPSDPVRSVTMQCSVLSDSANKTCSGGHSVCWFSAGSDESNLGLIYTPGSSDDECESSSEARAAQECVQNPSMEISSSYAGSYSCAVASCGKIRLGNLQLDSEAPNMQVLQIVKTALILLSGAVALSLALNVYLICIRKKNNCVTIKATSDQRSQQNDSKSMVYAAPTFTERKPGKVGRKNLQTTKDTIYSDVRTSEME